ncbi:hypothetical protein, conserved [Eimeria necatrix]|uniref:Uncharacterized protein n=1 Tax=Eimeria necatrix TaxID=51315 RepID=U6MZI0_9EIME|nr:hypothetical protein, conserved [Eimeria necatrix]CDJ67075.1 hypothetical protein, conserved [Eimeria necatrix]
MENTKHEKFLPLQALHLPSVQQRNLDRFEMSIRQSLRELRGVACLHTSKSWLSGVTASLASYTVCLRH